MAGKKGRSGRRPKPDVVKFAAGTYRADRSGNPADKANATGTPQKPAFQNVYAAELWDQVVGELVTMGVATKVDTAILQSMCELWGLYRMAYALAETMPIDKDARIAVVTYWAKFEQAAARCGLNPSDRCRLKVEKPRPEGIQARKRG